MRRVSRLCPSEFHIAQHCASQGQAISNVDGAGQSKHRPKSVDSHIGHIGRGSVLSRAAASAVLGGVGGASHSAHTASGLHRNARRRNATDTPSPVRPSVVVPPLIPPSPVAVKGGPDVPRGADRLRLRLQQWTEKRSVGDTAPDTDYDSPLLYGAFAPAEGAVSPSPATQPGGGLVAPVGSTPGTPRYGRRAGTSAGDAASACTDAQQGVSVAAASGGATQSQAGADTWQVVDSLDAQLKALDARAADISAERGSLAAQLAAAEAEAARRKAERRQAALAKAGVGGRRGGAAALAAKRSEKRRGSHGRRAAAAQPSALDELSTDIPEGLQGGAGIWEASSDPGAHMPGGYMGAAHGPTSVDGRKLAPGDSPIHAQPSLRKGGFAFRGGGLGGVGTAAAQAGDALVAASISSASMQGLPPTRRVVSSAGASRPPADIGAPPAHVALGLTGGGARRSNRDSRTTPLSRFVPPADSGHSSAVASDSKSTAGTEQQGGADFIQRNRILAQGGAKKLTEDEEARLKAWLQAPDSDDDSDSSEEGGERGSDSKGGHQFMSKTADARIRPTSAHTAKSAPTVLWGSLAGEGGDGTSAEGGRLSRRAARKRLAQLDSALVATAHQPGGSATTLGLGGAGHKWGLEGGVGGVDPSLASSVTGGTGTVRPLKLLPFFVTALAEEGEGGAYGGFASGSVVSAEGSSGASSHRRRAAGGGRAQAGGARALPHITEDDETEGGQGGGNSPSGLSSLPDRPSTALQGGGVYGAIGGGSTAHTSAGGRALPRGADPVIAQQRAQRQRKDALAAIDAALNTLGSNTFVPADDEPALGSAAGSASGAGSPPPPKAPSVLSGGAWDSVSVGGRHVPAQRRAHGAGSRMTALSAASSVRHVTRGDILIEAMKGRDFMADSDLASEADIRGVLDSLRGAMHPAVWQAYEAGADKVMQRDGDTGGGSSDSDSDTSVQGGLVARGGPLRSVSPLTSPCSIGSGGSSSTRSRSTARRWKFAPAQRSAAGSAAGAHGSSAGGEAVLPAAGNSALLRSVSPIVRSSEQRAGAAQAGLLSVDKSLQAGDGRGHKDSKGDEGRLDSSEEPPPTTDEGVAALANELAAQHASYDPTAAGFSADDVLLAAAGWGGLGSRVGGWQDKATGERADSEAPHSSDTDPAMQLRAQLVASRAKRAALREAREDALYEGGSHWKGGGGGDDLTDFMAGVADLPGFAWAAQQEGVRAGESDEGSAPPAAAAGDVSGLAAAAQARGGDGAEGGISSDEEHQQQDYGLERKSR